MPRKRLTFIGLTILLLIFIVLPVYAGTYEWAETYTEDFNTVYTGISLGSGGQSTHMVGTDTGLYRSTNGGASFTLAIPHGTRKLAYHTNQPSIIWAATTDDGVYGSNNGGVTWTEINGASLPDGDELWDLKALDVQGLRTARTASCVSTHVLIASDVTDGTVLCSNNNGATWSVLLATSSPRNLSIIEGNLYVASDGGLFRTTIPTSCSTPTWEQAAPGSWSQAYEIGKYDGAYFVAANDGIYIGNWTDSWTREWDGGQTNGFFTAYLMSSVETIGATTQNNKVIKRDESISSWTTYGAGLDLSTVHSLGSASPYGGGYIAYGDANEASNHAVWRYTIPVDSWTIGEVTTTQSGLDLLVEWSTIDESNLVGFNMYHENQGYTPGITQTYPEWTKINDQLIPAQNPGMMWGAFYSLTWPFRVDPVLGPIGLCQGPNRVLLEERDMCGTRAPHVIMADGNFLNITAFTLIRQTGRAIVVEVETGDEFHVGVIEVEYGYGCCGAASTWQHAASIQTDHAGTAQGGTYTLTFDLPQTSTGVEGFCARVTAQDAAANCNGPYATTGGWYPVLIQLRSP